MERGGRGREIERDGGGGRRKLEKREWMKNKGKDKKEKRHKYEIQTHEKKERKYD